MTKDERRLMSLKEKIAYSLAALNDTFYGPPTLDTYEEIEVLENRLGKTWDAINQEWRVIND